MQRNVSWNNTIKYADNTFEIDSPFSFTKISFVNRKTIRYAKVTKLVILLIEITIKIK